MAAIQVRIPVSGPRLISNHSLTCIQVLKCIYMNKKICLFQRPLKIQKNGLFLFEISFFVLDILAFSYYANQPRSQGLSSLPPLVVGRKTLVAAAHVTACDTNFSTGVESTNHFCRSQPGRLYALISTEAKEPVSR